MTHSQEDPMPSATEDPAKALSPQDLWDLAESTYDRFIRRAGVASDAPTISVTSRNSSFKVLVSPNIPFWQRFKCNTWEADTLDIFDKFITARHTYVDVGAWIGPTTFYAAHTAARTFAFEPDPVAFEELQQNLSANTDKPWAARIELHNAAASCAAGTIRMGSNTTGGDSTSSVFLDDRSTSWEVKTVSLPDFFALRRIEGPVFIKMDIEGYEYDLLPCLSDLFTRWDVTLFVSFHSAFLRRRLMEGREQENLAQKLARRIKFSARHLRLLDALPFRFFYDSLGRPLDLKHETLRAVRSGSFISTLLATNTRWPA